jgi:hypothetical protein
MKLAIGPDGQPNEVAEQPCLGREEGCGPHQTAASEPYAHSVLEHPSPQ